jgi:L,D-peptidoglycan transpeptidase YkuD (ErfK/YbiS/YcfS/YnhG family)
VALVVVLLAGTGVPAARGGDLPAYHPSRLTHVGQARQVVVVTSRGWSSSFARLRAYERRMDGSWRRRLGPVPARLGRNGFAPADRRRQGSATTPAGTFAVRWAFGTWADPGTRLSYRRVDADDWWPYDPRDPATYNVWQPHRSRSSDWRRSWAEDLSSYGRQYRYAAVLDFNLPRRVRAAAGERLAGSPADTERGGGIFLHVERPGATTGCVSVAQREMRALLRWLDPANDPVVVMGPRPAISRM